VRPGDYMPGRTCFQALESALGFADKMALA